MFTYKFKHPNTGEEITFTSETELSEEQVRNLIDDIISRDSSGSVKTSDDAGFFEKVKGYNNTITRGFQGGVLRLAGLLQDDPEIGKAYYDTADEIDAEWDESVRKSGVDPEGFFAQAAQAGGNMVPLIAGTVTTGALTGGTAPAIAFGSYMAAMQGASGWQAEASSKEYDRLIKDNPSLSKRDAAVLSMQNTQNQATIQGLKTGGITLAGGHLASKFGFGGVEAGRAASVVAPKGFKEGAKYALGSAAFEGLEEAADSLATTGLDWSQGWEDEDITLGQAFKRAGNDFVVGFILGGAIETGRVSLDKLSEDSSESEKLAKALASSEEKAKEEGEPFNSALERVLSNVNELSKSSASRWAREQLGNPKDLKESALLEMKISEIRRAKIVRDLDSEIEMLEAEEAASSEIKSVSEKQSFRDELDNLKKVRDEFKSGARDPLDIEDQQILDSLGLENAEEAYNVIKSGGSIPLTRDDGAVVTSVTQRSGEDGEGGNATDALGLTQKQPEQDIEEEVSEPEDKSMSSEVLSGSKSTEAKLDQSLKDADKLFSARDAQKRRRERQAEEESDSPRTSFNFKQPPEEEAPSKSSDLPKSDVAGAGMTAAEQRARSAQVSGKGPFQSAPQVRDRRAGQAKVDEAESRAKGKKVTYGGAENTVSEIVNESAANADIDGSTRGADGSVKDVGPSEIVDNAISEAEARAEEAGVNLTEGDKASIARKISERAEKGIPAAESATIQDGLKSLITAIESRLKRFQRSNAPLFNDPFFIGTIASSFPAAKRVALNAAKRALKAGISASDAADIAILKSKSYLKKNRIRISTEEELGLEFGVLEGISKDLIRASDSRGEKKFYPSDSSSLKRARGNKNLKEDLDAHNESTPADGRKINLPDLDDSQSYSDARTYMDSHIFGDISGKRGRDARPVLRPVKEEFTIRTTPKDYRAVGEVLGKEEGSKRKALSWKNRKLSQNKPHSVRLDVSSLRNHSKYVSTIYDSIDGKGRVAGYAPVSSTIVDVDGGGIKLDAVPVLAVIEQGRKYPMSYVVGLRNEVEVDLENKVVRELDSGREISLKDLHNTDRWSQVAINPRRAGYAYERLSGLPVSGFVKGTKLINLGGTVFVEGPENVVYGDPLDFLNVPLAKLVMMRKKLKRWMGGGSRNKRVGHYMSFMGVGAVGQVTLKMVDSSLGLAIDAIIAGRKSVNEAIEIAFNSFSALDRKMVDRDDFINAMRGKLAIAIERIASGDSEKAAISFAVKATQVIPVSKIETIDKIEEESSIEDFNLSKFIEKYEYLDRNAEIASDIENLSVSRFNRVGGLFDLFDALSSGLRKLTSNQYVANSIGLRYFANALRSFSSNKINFQRLYGTELASLMTASEKVVGEFGGEINAEVGAYLRLQAQAVKDKKDMPSMDGLSDRAKKIVALRNKVFALQGAHAKQYRVMKKKDGKWVEGEFNMGEHGHYQIMEPSMVSSLIKLADGKTLNSTDRANIKQFVKAHGNKDADFATRWARKNFGPKEGNDVLIVATSDRLSSLEKSRETELPLELVDFGINAFMKQSSAWATRMAQIASFGQSTTETTDIFDAYIDMLTDRGDKDGASETLKIIKSARDDVYGRGILDAPKALVNSVSFLSRWTSLLHMVSIASLLTQMTSVGNAAVKIQSMRGLARVTGSLIKLIASGNTLSFGDVEALNVTGGVARAMVGNYTDGTELSNGVEKVLRIGGVAFSATAGLGDRITRVIAANVANAALHSVRSARESGTNSDFVEEMQAFCKEHGLEYESVVNGDKEAVAQFYIAFVGETQFTYSETQRASASNNFWFKNIFRYYEFSSQMMEFTHRNISRSYDRHGFSAAATSTVFTVAMAGLSAELITQLRQLMGIRPEDDETWEEIANRDGVIDKVVGVGERWLENLNNAAVFGFLSYAYNTAKFKHGDYSLTDIPIFSAARKIESIASDGSKPKDVKIAEIVSEINFLKKPYNEAISAAGKFGSDNKSARIKNAEFQKRKIRSILNRFEEQTDGFEFGEGWSKPSEVAYYANQVAESLYLGDVAEAKDRALIFADKSTDKEQSWNSLTRMVKSKQPLHLRGSLNKKEKDQFRIWAEKNLSESDQKEVRDASLNYIQTALDAGLITVDGKNPDEKNLMKMKQAMTGVVKEKSRTPLTSGADSEYRKLFDRKRSSPIGVK